MDSLFLVVLSERANCPGGAPPFYVFAARHVLSYGEARQRHPLEFIYFEWCFAYRANNEHCLTFILSSFDMSPPERSSLSHGAPGTPNPGVAASVSYLGRAGRAATIKG